MFHISKLAFTHLVSRSISHMSDVNSHPNLPSSFSLTAMTANPILDWADTQKETDEWRPSPFLPPRHAICKSRYPFHIQNLLDRQKDTHPQQKVKATSNKRFTVLHNCFPRPSEDYVHLNLQVCGDLFRMFTRKIHRSM